MTFELQPRSDSWWPEPETLRRLELTHDVTVSVPQRNRDSAVLVTLMAMERNVGTWRMGSGDAAGWWKGDQWTLCATGRHHPGTTISPKTICRPL